MRSIGGFAVTCVTVFCLIVFSSFPAQADGNRYENLMAKLAAARSQSEADTLSSEIWRIWLTAPDEVAQEVLDAALVRRRSRDYLGAIRQLDRLIGGWPDYAEGWNQRATVHFLRGDYDASLVDVAEVLAREPRHFGALSGKALILYRQGRTALALITLREALRHNPFLRERAMLEALGGTEL
ncbi:MAG: tetratricopeptide repeat protein [Rhodobacter sp.]|nr:tetratricopeptide repeat protein [Rhodobacter sp.]MCY4243471.1 tetratricopeptide repeat protein [Rhodobacter sp.]